MSSRSPSQRLPIAAVLAVGIGAAGAVALAVTNPSLEDYKQDAGTRLVKLATHELCEERGFPMLLRLWIKDCPDLVASQKGVIADLAGQFTTRWNFGVASVFSTRIGGQELLPGLRLPGLDVLTVGIGGRFLVLCTETDSGGLQ